MLEGKDFRIESYSSQDYFEYEIHFADRLLEMGHGDSVVMPVALFHNTKNLDDIGIELLEELGGWQARVLSIMEFFPFGSPELPEERYQRRGVGSAFLEKTISDGKGRDARAVVVKTDKEWMRNFLWRKHHFRMYTEDVFYKLL